MKLTIEQKQEVYEKLLELGCCDLLAALIAERSEHTLCDNLTISASISGCFRWDESPEGLEFWQYMNEYVEELEEDFLPYDTVLDGSQEPLQIEIIPPVSYNLGDIVTLEDKKLICTGVSSKSLTWLEKVKLFFGRLFYKV